MPGDFQPQSFTQPFLDGTEGIDPERKDLVSKLRYDMTQFESDLAKGSFAIAWDQFVCNNGIKGITESSEALRDRVVQVTSDT